MLKDYISSGWIVQRKTASVDSYIALIGSMKQRVDWLTYLPFIHVTLNEMRNIPWNKWDLVTLFPSVLLFLISGLEAANSLVYFPVWALKTCKIYSLHSNCIRNYQNLKDSGSSGVLDLAPVKNNSLQSGMKPAGIYSPITTSLLLPQGLFSGTLFSLSGWVSLTKSLM